VVTLCVFAHQDDEMAMGGRILRSTRRGDRVRCVYLTDGSGWGIDPSRRDDESRAVLAALGVAAEDVFFVGAAGAGGEGERVPDGNLVNALPATWARLVDLAGGWDVDEVLCPAYEGGHMDHDAANVLAIALGRMLDVPAGVRQFPLYNGWGTRGGRFRVMHPSPGMGQVRTRRLAVRDGLTVIALVRHYRSQRKTWLGLSPEAFVKLVVMRREYSSTAEPGAVLDRPHPGPLFYERRFGFDYDEWRRGADAFVADHAPWRAAVSGD